MDEQETIVKNPKSYVAWKNEADALRAQLKEAQAEIEAGNLEIERLSYVAKETDTRLNDAMLQIERLNAENISFACNLRGKHATTGATYEILRTQLAASQAREQQLLEALENHSGNYKLSKDECKRINSLLDSPSDTTALEAMIAKAGEVMRERCAKFCDEVESQYFDGYEFRNVLPSDLCEDIRALPGVTLQDLQNKIGDLK